jgi:hypothetical protein
MWFKMAVMEVLIHVPGDREAAVEELKKTGLEYRELYGSLFIKNTYIYIGKYGEYGNRICLYSDFAKSDAGKPIKSNTAYGEKCMPLKGQVAIFNRLKRAIMKSRAEFYRKHEESMTHTAGERQKLAEQMHRLINFEKNVINEEHRLGDQLNRAGKLVIQFMAYMPNATYRSRGNLATVDNGAFASQAEHIANIRAYLEKTMQADALYITKSAKSPIMVQKAGERAKIQKTHLRKLSTLLNKLAGELKYFLRSGLRVIQITTPMRKHIRAEYGHLYRVFSWYAELFKKESKK